MLRCLVLLTIALLLSSCAKPPRQELDAAEYTVNRARAMQAMEFAPTEYQAAQSALADARAAMEKADYSRASDSLEFALKHANRSIVLAEEGRVKRAEEENRLALEEEKARQAALPKISAEKVTQPAPTPPATKPVAKPAPKPKDTPTTSYTVGDGETLWTISAQSQVYNEGFLWPLLYQANRDQIKNPRQIFPGQSLSIRRDMTQKDLDDARSKARESDIFPVTEATPPKQ